MVDTKIPRWQQVDRNGNLVDKPAIGVGFIRTRPAGHTLLYEHGYTRTPRNMFSILPRFVKNWWRRIRAITLRVPSEPARAGDVNAIVAADDPLVSGLETVVAATRFALIAFVAALLVTLVSILFNGNTQAVIQWFATLAFVLAWAAVNSGIHLREWDWLSRSCKKSLLWWARIFAPVALVNLVFTILNK